MGGASDFGPFSRYNTNITILGIRICLLANCFGTGRLVGSTHLNRELNQICGDSFDVLSESGIRFNVGEPGANWVVNEPQVGFVQPRGCVWLHQRKIDLVLE